jgi:hypothetical protein
MGTPVLLRLEEERERQKQIPCGDDNKRGKDKVEAERASGGK